MADRRQHPQTTDLQLLLQRIPASVLLSRMPGPVLGVDEAAAVAYANPAADVLLGYGAGALIGRGLPTLLAGHSSTRAEDCLAMLRSAAGSDVIEWSHADGYSVRTAVSTPLLLRESDPFLMIHVTDVTELHWGA